MSIVLLSFPNGQQVIGTVVEESEREFVLDNPIQIVFSNPLSINTTVYSAKYMPFANLGRININKFAIVAYADVNDEIAGFYDKTVDSYKDRNVNYVSGDDLPDDAPESDSRSVQEVAEALLDKRQKTIH